jgi:hypothetical protein
MITNLPEGYTLERVEPSEVDAVISGVRRNLFFVPKDALRVEIDAQRVQIGRRTFEVSPESIVHPQNVRVKSFEPDKLKLVVVRGTPEPT